MNKEKKAIYMKKYRQRPEVIELRKKNREQNKDKIKIQAKQYYENNKTDILNQQKGRKDELNTRRRERYKLNLNDFSIKNKGRQRNYYINNKENISQKHKIYYMMNLPSIKNTQKNWNELNKDKRKINHAKRWKTDTLYKLKIIMRNRIFKIIKRERMDKNSPTREMIGCSYDYLKQHLEKQFTENMNWDNQGEWHIDHIIPLAKAKNEQELYELCNYKNLQPLWAIDNLKKGDRIVC